MLKFFAMFAAVFQAAVWLLGILLLGWVALTFLSALGRFAG